MQDLQHTLNQLLDYLRGIWIKKRYVLICSWMICSIGFAYVAMLPDEYKSEAQVYVDTRSILQNSLRGLMIQSNPQQQVEMMAKTLLSRANVEEIARQADLDITVTTDDDYQELINDLTSDIRLQSTGRDNIYRISYYHQDAEVARDVVQQTLDLFVEGSLGNNRRDSDTANRFLDEQIAEYESRLLESEQRLADFKRQYSDILPQQGNFYDNLSILVQNLEELQLTIKEMEQQSESLKNQLKPTENEQGELTVATRFDTRIDTLQERLDELRLRYTSLHPDVIETESLLDSLKQARKDEIASLAASSGDNANMNLLTQEIRLEISRLDSSIASMQVREKDFQSKISLLRSKIDLVPQVEAELTGLNRDYGIMQQKYEELLNRRESTELSRRAEVSGDDLQFRIIEPPLRSQEPDGPKRLILYSGVLVLGYGAGIALAFFISQLNPVLVRAHQLSNLTSFPVLGSVTHLHIDEINKSNRIKILIFTLLSGLLVFIYFGLMGAELLNFNIFQRVF